MATPTKPKPPVIDSTDERLPFAVLDEPMRPREGETDQAYAAFLLWCMQAPTERSDRSVSIALDMARSSVRYHRRRWAWERRAVSVPDSEWQALRGYRLLMDLHPQGSEQVAALRVSLDVLLERTGFAKLRHSVAAQRQGQPAGPADHELPPMDKPGTPPVDPAASPQEPPGAAPAAKGGKAPGEAPGASTRPPRGAQRERKARRVTEQLRDEGLLPDPKAEAAKAAAAQAAKDAEDALEAGLEADRQLPAFTTALSDDELRELDVRSYMVELRNRVVQDHLQPEHVSRQILLIDAGLAAVAKGLRNGTIKPKLSDVPALLKARALLTGMPTEQVAHAGTVTHEHQHTVAVESARIRLARERGDPSQLLGAMRDEVDELRVILDAVPEHQPEPLVYDVTPEDEADEAEVEAT